MEKKAQGLSLNTIIIAIIVLIVLVVIIMVFTGYFSSRFTPGVTSCENSGGACVFEAEEGKGCGFDSFGSKLATISGKCPGNQICCSKGLGKGEAQQDFSNCGEEYEQPCPGNNCNTAQGLEPIDGKCVTRCTAQAGCVAADSCVTKEPVGYCSTGVCCSAEKSSSEDEGAGDSQKPAPVAPPAAPK